MPGGNASDREDALEHGKADQLFQDFFLAHHVDGKLLLRPGAEVAILRALGAHNELDSPNPGHAVDPGQAS